MDFSFHEEELWPVYVPNYISASGASHANLPEELIEEYTQAYNKFIDVLGRVSNIIEPI